MAAARQVQRRLTSILLNDRPFFPLPQEAIPSLLQRRLTSLIRHGRSHLPFSQAQGSTWPSFRAAGSRRVHSKTESAENTESLTEVPNSTSGKSEVKFKALSNLKASPRHDLAMIFTCRVCETRSMKTLCRESYEKGVVVVRCGGCNNLHLIADRLGWFGEPGSVEDLLVARGEEVRKSSVDTLNLTLEDLAGTESKL